MIFDFPYKDLRAVHAEEPPLYATGHIPGSESVQEGSMINFALFHWPCFNLRKMIKSIKAELSTDHHLSLYQ